MLHLGMITTVFTETLILPLALLFKMYIPHPLPLTFLGALYLQLTFLPLYMYLFSSKKLFSNPIGTLITILISLISVINVYAIQYASNHAVEACTPHYSYPLILFAVINSIIHSVIHFYSTKHHYKSELITFFASIFFVFLPVLYVFSNAHFLTSWFVICSVVSSWIIKASIYFYEGRSLCSVMSPHSNS